MARGGGDQGKTAASTKEMNHIPDVILWERYYCVDQTIWPEKRGGFRRKETLRRVKKPAAESSEIIKTLWPIIYAKRKGTKIL